MADRRALYLRLNQKEFDRLQSDARVAGVNPQELLKMRYFSRKPLAPVFSAESSKAILEKLNEITNGMNRIALPLSASPFDGMFVAVANVERIVFELRMVVSGKIPEKLRRQIGGLYQNQIP
jgi:hypothetical protein